jgi:hypothetical protein
MYAVVSSRGTRRWLSGVFLDRVEAEASVTALPAHALTHHVLESIPIERFPLFIIEDSSGFTFFDAIGAAHAIAVMPSPSVDGEPILFAILSEYRPDIHGRDEMGRLRHVHLDNEHVAELRRVGLGSLTEHSREVKRCDECRSDYFADSAKIGHLCPECAHHLYGYPTCAHNFLADRCVSCGWDGSRSTFVKERLR